MPFSVARSPGERIAHIALKDKTCAYCGESKHPREHGHVIPRSLYPSTVDSRVQRPTVPECAECKKAWQDAEAHFRAIVVMAGDPNAEVMELWNGPILRSFEK